jgi:hypothetical protein
MYSLQIIIASHPELGDFNYDIPYIRKRRKNSGAWRQNKSVVAPVVVGPEVP